METKEKISRIIESIGMLIILVGVLYGAISCFVLNIFAGICTAIACLIFGILIIGIGRIVAYLNDIRLEIIKLRDELQEANRRQLKHICQVEPKEEFEYSVNKIEKREEADIDQYIQQIIAMEYPKD